MNFLDGISIHGYRSFKEEAKFDNLKKINIIIGQNNSGKSNLLRFLCNQLEPIIKGKSNTLDKHYDLPNLYDENTNKDLEFNTYTALKLRNDSFILKQALSEINLNQELQDKFKNGLFSKKDSFWFYIPIKTTNSHEIHRINTNQVNLDNETAFRLLQIIQPSSILHRNTNYPIEILKPLNLQSLKNISISYIPALRSALIKKARSDVSLSASGLMESAEALLNGHNLVEILRNMHTPSQSQNDLRRKFINIEKLISEILDKPDLKIQPVAKENQITIEVDNKRLEISELGSGIEQILVIATACTHLENQIVCIEEPETNLHPTLQKRLIKYLHEQTNNQYFITTHSPFFLDAVQDDISVHFVELDNGFSKVKTLISDSDKFHAIQNLGYKASDILQSNYVIWVEGPTDRLYIKKWIEHKDKTLVEGVHYSIMFYGGRLLAHLSGNSNFENEDKDVINDFIKLITINRNMGIVIDSDKSDENSPINSTKERIKNEFEKNNHFTWITEGREIENYIHEGLWGNVMNLKNDGKNKNLKKYQKFDPKKFMDKMEFCKAIIGQTYTDDLLNVFDLDSKLNALISSIKQANHI